MIDSTYELRSDTYDEGWDAFRDGVDQDDNPYQDDRAKWWDDGWEACHRENIGPLPGEVGHRCNDGCHDCDESEEGDA